MIKMTQLLLAGAAAFALSDVGLAQDTPPKPPGRAFADYVSPSDLGLRKTLPLRPCPCQARQPRAVAVAALKRFSGRYPTARRAGLNVRDVNAAHVGTHADRCSLFRPRPAARHPAVPGPGLVCWGTASGRQADPLQPLGSSRAVHAEGHSDLDFRAASHAPLDWTVSPYLFLGYRLPSGFGDFAVAYRYLATVGSMGVRGAANGPAILSSRLAFNMIDLDYSSHELNFGHGWDMKPTLGLRILTLFFDSQSDQPFALAAAGNGTFQKRETNNLVGLGPHAALELSRHLGNSGWALWLRTDFTDAFDWINDGAFTRSTTLGPAGRPLASQTYVFGHEDTPILNVQVGVTWKPSRYSGTRLFLGYQYEHFWALQAINTFSNGTTASLGQLTDQGVVMQATFNY